MSFDDAGWPVGRVSTLHGTTYLDFAYAYDDNGNITWQQFGHRSGDPCNAFSYDGLDRLDYAGYLSDVTDYEDFTYDDVGNRQSVETYTATETYGVDQVTNQYDAIGSATQAYNAAGQLVADYRGYSYEYDYDGHLTEISDSNGTIAEMTYDALGRRIRFENEADSITTDYYYDDRYQVLTEYTSGQAQSYAYGNEIDEVLLMWTSSDEYYYAHDHLGSIVALIDDTGDVVERYEYDACGKCVAFTAGVDGQWFTADDDPCDYSVFGNPYTFTARRQDIANGDVLLQYNRWRYYDTYMGCWTSPDPLGIIPNAVMANEKFEATRQYQDGQNIYEYVMSSPIRLIDAYGLVCGVRVYTESSRMRHKGLDVNGEDIDYGAIPPEDYAPGYCPWKYNDGTAYGRDKMLPITYEKTKRRKRGVLKYGGDTVPKPCCMATCPEIRKCLKRICQQWNGTQFDVISHNCWVFTHDAMKACCLQKDKPTIWY